MRSSTCWTRRLALVLTMSLVMTVSMTPSVSAWTSANVAVLEQFEYQGNSHFDFGKAMGARFREKIAERLAQNTKLQTRLLPYVQTTTEGKSIYAAFLETHETTFPEYMEELRGIANGSGIFFETIFVMNLSEEFDDAVPETYTAGAGSAFIKQKTLRCSDVVLVGGPDDLRVVAHNEDSGASDLNHTAIIIAKIGDKPKFVAYTYLGDLPSGAFGFNDKGVAFTLNFVQPTDTETGGLGRGFISRDLLWSTDSADAMQRIMRPHQASGHNYQLMDVNTKRIWNVEGAALNRYAGQEFLPPRERNNVTAFFHANQYQLLNISQPPYDSSLHRLKRYSESPKPKTVDEALQILGDQHDRLYPVFHDVYSHERGELSGWTLITIVFDLNAKKAVSYTGNPSKGQRELIWDLEQLTVEKISVQALA